MPDSKPSDQEEDKQPAGPPEAPKDLVPDLVPEHANALLMLAEILDARDLGAAAAATRSEAIVKLRAKGNLAAIAHLHDSAARGQATSA